MILNEGSYNSLNRLLAAMQKHQQVELVEYSIPHLVIILEGFMEEHKVRSVDELTDKVTLSGYWYEKLFENLFVSDTEIFRDPTFWASMQNDILPSFKDEINVWFPDLSSGEELYSLLIAAKETECYDRINIHASSVCENKIEIIKNGFLNARSTNQNADNYKRFNGLGQIEDFFHLSSNKFHLRSGLLDNVFFSFEHFMKEKKENYYDLVFFRNRMLYFNTNWQKKAIASIERTLKKGGLLAIGINEVMHPNTRFEAKNKHESIYKKA